MVLSGCSQEVITDDYLDKGIEQSSSKGLLQVSWESVISTDYQGNLDALNENTLSSMNPSEEKQRVEFVLFETGEARLSIEHLAKNEGIKIPHEDLPDDRSPVKKTVIYGGEISWYDGSGVLLGSESVDRLDYSSWISDIKQIKETNSKEDINRALRNFQSQFFKVNLEKFLENIKANNPIVREIEEFQILEENETYVTIRVDLAQFEPGQTGINVMLIDKNKNRMVANRIYTEGYEILQTTYYGYSKKDIETLDAIRVEEPLLLEEPVEVTKVTLNKISNLNISLN
ncbi:hypothetical protein [Cecembia calidifontis]|jgi:hypothetical protein|uniref:Uncharacterized protein n=1 Tax=Cecembia calidifontis TaxID=1187080 RepID=A0A4V2F6B0_9BACT|nr:hypothetical protein [Cecembia calidifontis]RZS95689.1 hypothetical protein BC751_1228 [Cecembia calidifontis]